MAQIRLWRDISPEGVDDQSCCMRFREAFAKRPQRFFFEFEAGDNEPQRLVFKFGLPSLYIRYSIVYSHAPS